MEHAIAAIATPYGEGGIGIIRISGLESRDILEKIFKPAGKQPLVDKRLTYGEIVNPRNGQVLDEVMAVYMKAPATYTREDVVEINCHGSVVSLKNVLDLVLEEGAELADRGEFTKRAFLNGRIDLTQAEAVIDVIKAKTEKNFEVALSQLEGGLSSEIKNIRELLVNSLVNITVNIDYPDEDIEEIVFSDLIRDIEIIIARISKLLDTASTGKIIREGIKIAIVGKPNVGKSSLMNIFMKENRAIVTDIPGTTRDTIYEQITIAGVAVQLIDTAGIRDTDDVIEKIGIEKTKEAFNNSDLVIVILDSSKDLEIKDIEILEMLEGRNAFILLNKADLKEKINEKDVLKYASNKIIKTSFANNIGIDQLEEALKNEVYGGNIYQKDSLLITNARHERLLKDAYDSLNDGLSMVKLGEPLEFIEVDVNKAYQSLGEIIGETVADDIINEVFARFCLGK